jgi:hypothetical protein
MHQEESLQSVEQLGNKALSTAHMGFMIHGHKLNLSSLQANAKADKSLQTITDKVVANFEQLQAAGLVMIDNKMSASLTLQGKLLLDKDDWREQVQLEQAAEAPQPETTGFLEEYNLPDFDEPPLPDEPTISLPDETTMPIQAQQELPQKLTVQMSRNVSSLEVEAAKTLAAEKGVMALGSAAADVTLGAATGGIAIAVKKTVEVAQAIATTTNTANVALSLGR